jgi:hypothetical protein
MESAYITNCYRYANYAVVVLLTNIDVQPGQTVSINDVGNDFDAEDVLITATPQFKFTGVNTQGVLTYDKFQPVANQILYYNEGDQFTMAAVQPYGALTYATPACTWIDFEDIENWLGIPLADESQQTFLEQCAAAANEFIYRRRVESGYTTDQLDTAPNASVALATIMYGGALYRQRGAIDQFASFSEMGSAPVVGLSPIIKQLAGLSRPQVA